MDKPHSSRMYGPPDSSVIFPNASKKAISVWKDPTAVNTPSYLEFFHVEVASQFSQ